MAKKSEMSNEGAELLKAVQQMKKGKRSSTQTRSNTIIYIFETGYIIY